MVTINAQMIQMGLTFSTTLFGALFILLRDKDYQHKKKCDYVVILKDYTGGVAITEIEYAKKQNNGGLILLKSKRDVKEQVPSNVEGRIMDFGKKLGVRKVITLVTIDKQMFYYVKHNLEPVETKVDIKKVDPKNPKKKITTTTMTIKEFVEQLEVVGDSQTELKLQRREAVEKISANENKFGQFLEKVTPAILILFMGVGIKFAGETYLDMMNLNKQLVSEISVCKQSYQVLNESIGVTP